MITHDPSRTSRESIALVKVMLVSVIAAMLFTSGSLATRKPELEIGEVVIEASAPILTGGRKDPVTILETQASTSFVSDTVRRQAIGAPDLLPPPDQPALASGSGCLAPFLGLGKSPKSRMIKAAKAWEEMRWQEVIDQLTPIALEKAVIAEKPDAFYYIGRSKHYLNDVSGAANAYEMLRNGYPDHPLNEHALYALGWIYLDSENTAQAMNALDQLSERFPASTLAPFIRYLRAAIHNKDRQYSSALENLEGIIAGYPMFPQMADVQFWSAENQFYLGKYELANRNYTLYLQNYSEGDKRVEALYGRAFSYLETRDHRKALVDFQVIIDTYPNNRLSADAAFQAGKLAVYLDDRQQALAFFRKATALIPGDSPRKQEAEAWILYEQDKFETAAALFEDAASGYPHINPTGTIDKRRAELLFLSALSCFKAGKYAAAAEKFDTMTMETSGDLRLAAMANAGVSWLKLQRLDAAQERLQEALNSDGDLRGRSLYMLYSAEVLFRLKQYNASINMFQQLQKIAEDIYKAEIIRGIAWNCYALEKWEEAAVHFGELADQFSSSDLHAEALLRRAESLFNNKEYTRAKAGFLMLISQYPLHPEAFEARLLNARADWIRGDTEMGFEGLRDALRFAPDDTARQTVRLTMGELLQENERFQDALDEYRKAYQEAPQGDRAVEALLKRADSLYNLDRYAESAEVYHKIIADFPDSDYAGNAQYSIGLIYFRQNRLDEYLEECSRTVNAHPGTRQSALALEGAAAILTERNRLEEAMELQKKLLEDYSAYIDAQLVQFRLAQNLLATEDNDAAEIVLNEILSGSGRGRYVADATMELAAIASTQGDADRALELYETVINQFPFHPRRTEAVEQAAAIRSARSQWTEAMALWTLIIDENLDPPMIRHAHAAMVDILLLKNDDFETAQKHAEKVGETTDRKMLAYSQLLQAKILDKQGYIDESLKQYMKITYLFPEQTDMVLESLIRAASILKEQEKQTQYKRVMEKAVQKADTAERQERLDRLKLETGISGGSE